MGIFATVRQVAFTLIYPNVKIYLQIYDKRYKIERRVRMARVSRESIFSDLNNLVIITTTSNLYETAFGFIEQEVFDSLDEFGLSDKKDNIKAWYDGFTFGDKKDIYNPWSIINYLKFKKFTTYWADSSSNGLINSLIQKGSPYIKTMMEMLISGKNIKVPIDEQIVFSELDYSEDAVWSLIILLAFLCTAVQTLMPA